MPGSDASFIWCGQSFVAVVDSTTRLGHPFTTTHIMSLIPKQMGTCTENTPSLLGVHLMCIKAFVQRDLHIEVTLLKTCFCV